MSLHFRHPLEIASFNQIAENTGRSRAGRWLYRDFGKRVLDIVLVLLAAIPVVTVILVMCCMIALDGRSPFYVQQRVGKHGKPFRMWKLRSMVADAELSLAAYLEANPAARIEWNHAQKLRNDPRITLIGRFIRKSSIDELPQLWNVLRGDMSLVGPRPMLPEQQNLYPGTAYYALRPGITGFWQTSVRNKSSFADRADFDVDYMNRISLATDAGVILRTFKVVANCTGY